LALAITELVLRGYGLHRPVLYEEDEAAGFRIKPNQQADYLGGSVRINNWGLRDHRDLPSGPSEKRRIIILGDSVTWGGLRLAQDRLFPALLEGQLNGAEVLNGGVNGASVVQMVARYQGHWRELEPDLVVVYSVPADFTRPPVVRLNGDSLAFPLEQPTFATPVAVELPRLSLSSYPGLGWLKPPAPAYVSVDTTDDERTSLALDALRKLTNDVGADKIIVVVGPTLNGPPVDVKLLDAMTVHGIRYVELAASMAISAALFVDDGVHYTEEGHANVATALAEILAACCFEE
jgi:lysophospholipase L1-like esterase